MATDQFSGSACLDYRREIAVSHMPPTAVPSRIARDATNQRCSRVASLAVLHLHLMGSYLNAADPGLVIINVLNVQQLEVYYSFLIVIIPQIKSLTEQLL